MNTYRNSSFSKAKVIALAALLAGTGLAHAGGMHSHKHKGAQVGGQVQTDYVRFSGGDRDKNGTGSNVSDNATRFSNGANIRRANLHVSGNLSNSWGYLVRADFGHAGTTNSSTTERDRVRVQRAELHHHYNDFTFTIGQMYVPLGMEHTTSSSDLMFMERSNMNALYERKHLGISAYTHGDMFTANGAIVAQSYAGSDGALGLNDSSDEALNQNDKFSYMLRVTISPVHEHDTAYHIGLNAKHKSLNINNRATGGAGTAVRGTVWSTGPELRSRQSPNGILSTLTSPTAVTAVTAADQVKSFNLMGLELGAKWDAFTMQAEYTRLKAKYNSVTNQTYKGWYVQGAWVFAGGNGRHYNFKKGVFERPHNLAGQDCGVWELALRYSNLNLNNANQTTSAANDVSDAGKVSGWTVGVNWYATNNVMFKANYIQNKFKFRNATDRKAKALGVRAEFVF